MENVLKLYNKMYLLDLIDLLHLAPHYYKMRQRILQNATGIVL